MRALISVLIICAAWSNQFPTRDLVIVISDSAELRDAPSTASAPIRFARATLQLGVLSESADSAWYRVAIGEDRGYQLRHDEQFWVRRSDVVEATTPRAEVTTDVSLLEVPAGYFGRRATPEEFMSSEGAVADSFYVSAVYYPRTPTPTCSPPLSVCGRTYRPGEYFLEPGGRSASERHLYERLYGDGAVRARYELAADVVIETVREKLVLARVMMEQAGCYAEGYRGTDVVVLRDTARSLHAHSTSTSVAVESKQLFEPTARSLSTPMGHSTGLIREQFPVWRGMR